MSIPRQDPNFTEEDLRKAGVKLLDAGYEYWEAVHKFNGKLGGAVIWLESADGRVVIITRGEYRQQLMSGVDKLGNPVHMFTPDAEEDD